MLNQGRQLAYKTFRETLDSVYGRKGITEAGFRDQWLERLRAQPGLTLDGWYCPPPNGMTVLMATDERPERVNYSSLRLPDAYAGETEMDWTRGRGLLFAYCSPVDRETGLIGDFQLTLYCGKDPRILAHFRAAYEATWRGLSLITDTTQSRTLFNESQRIFAEYGLCNSVVSFTDAVEVDLGMSLPCIGPEPFSGSCAMTPDLCTTISGQRRFINGVTDWPLREMGQVSIEPQLRSTKDEGLPQVSFHYVVALTDGVQILDECDAAWPDYGLL